MIVEFIFNLLYGIVALLLTPIQLIFQPLGSMMGLVELLATASIFIPMTTFGACLSIWLGFHVLRFGISIMNWLIAKIPTID